MTHEVLISFIIPAHNAEKTIERAINSIRADDTDNIEVIVVENGSTDNTVDVVNKLVARIPSIRMLRSEKGVSNARNMGIKNARGKWIVFMDADDWLLTGALKVLINDVREQNIDLILYGYESGVRLNTVSCSKGNLLQEEKCNDGLIEMLENPTRYMQVWSKIFSKRIIDEHNILFNPELRLSEDSDFTLRYAKHCKTMLFSEHAIYHYDLNVDSVMRVFDGSKSDSYIHAMHVSAKAIVDEEPQIQKAFDKYILMHLNVLMVREVFAVNNHSSRREKMQQMKIISRNDIFANAIKRTAICECMSFRMIPILFLKFKQNWLAACVYYVRSKMNARKEKIQRAINANK